jgi:hypothetical protein
MPDGAGGHGVITWSYEVVIAKFLYALAEKDKLIAEKDKLLAESRAATLAAKDQIIQNLQNR